MTMKIPGAIKYIIGIILLFVATWIAVDFIGPLWGPILILVILLTQWVTSTPAKRYKPKDYWRGP